MNSSLMDVSIAAQLVVPQALVQQGEKFLEFLMGSIVAGEIPAQITIETAKQPEAVAAVPAVIRDEWKRLIAADSGELFNIKLELKNADSDEEGRLVRAFYAWPIGTPVVEVAQWFKAQEK